MLMNAQRKPFYLKILASMNQGPPQCSLLRFLGPKEKKWGNADRHQQMHPSPVSIYPNVCEHGYSDFSHREKAEFHRPKGSGRGVPAPVAMLPISGADVHLVGIDFMVISRHMDLTPSHILSARSTSLCES